MVPVERRRDPRARHRAHPHGEHGRREGQQPRHEEEEVRVEAVHVRDGLARAERCAVVRIFVRVA